MIVVRILAVAAGSALVSLVLLSALQTVVLPKGGLTRITRFVFATADRVFIRRHGFPARFGWGRLYAPVSLVMLPLAWATLVMLGFAAIFWGFQAGDVADSTAVSGSSLFTLGFVKPVPNGLVLLTFLEALIGLGLVALLISFLPTLYSAYSEREQGVVLLRPLLGSPPEAGELMRRLHVGQSLGSSSLWASVSKWFATLEQSHTAFPSLSSFPPQVDGESWVVTAGVLLDAAALATAVIDQDDAREGREFVLVLAHGLSSISMVGIAAGLPGDAPRSLLETLADPATDVVVRVTREEFDAAVDVLGHAGLRIRTDLDEGWRVFRLLRASYEDWILGLSGLTHAPPAPWTSDRPYAVGRPHFFGGRPLAVTKP